MSGLYTLAKPFIMALDPERAHELSLQVLKSGVHPVQTRPDPPSLAISLWGLDFRNPIGMAAGFDKNGEIPDALLKTGFGFTEIGSVTPLPQDGNPRPRVFRLKADHAIINRLGFNNDGHEKVCARLRARRPATGVTKGIVGVNIGANKTSANRIDDYVLGIRAFAPLADYLTVNISSPNTPGLRDLQAGDELRRLLERVIQARDHMVDEGVLRRPVLLKIAPDLDDDSLKNIAETVLAQNLDGVIVSNTTLSRPHLRDRKTAAESGGLSGRPLFNLSTHMLAKFARLTSGQIPLIGVGGIDSGAAVFEKIRAGASLVQLYTGLVYGGPELIRELKADLEKCLARAGHKSISDAVGTGTREWAEKEII
ncbi:MAG: quinone-dependent dihydroorotate dehydrogenase [Fimbriimonadaceae bacterium]|nr:quinone-dependent dihydroorotate dehydrogenase [Alphaproteobacteria bacterium]